MTPAQHERWAQDTRSMRELKRRARVACEQIAAAASIFSKPLPTGFSELIFGDVDLKKLEPAVRRALKSLDEDHARWLKTIERLKKSGWFDEVEACMVQYRAACKNKSDPRSKPWLEVASDLPISKTLILKEHLPTPASSLGRPHGSDDEAMVSAITPLVDRGERPTSAAKKLLRASGVNENQLKNRADYIVKLWKKRKIPA